MSQFTFAASPIVSTGKDQTSRIIMRASLLGEEIVQIVVCRQSVQNGNIEYGNGNYYPHFHYVTKEEMIYAAYAKFESESKDLLFGYPLASIESMRKHIS